jgi:hypothetical protein
LNHGIRPATASEGSTVASAFVSLFSDHRFQANDQPLQQQSKPSNNKKTTTTNNKSNQQHHGRQHECE